MGWIKINTNKKLGNMGAWSITAQKYCPAATESCLKVCYVKGGFYNFPKNRKALDDAGEFSKTPEFVSTISREIKNNLLSVIRVHVAGDFYTPEYVDKWAEIAKRNPRSLFYAYTRSWTKKEFYPSFSLLAKLSNFILLASLDSCNQNLHIPHFMRRAYMSSFDESPQVPVDIIFRVQAGNERRKFKAATTKFKNGKLESAPVSPKVVKRIQGNRVCPKESGLMSSANENLTCAVCQLCF